MIQKRSKPKKENAVSPVVGVMLLLLITIVIAAVVAAFATGAAPNTTSPPTASLTVKIPMGDEIVSDVIITHNSGTALPTKNLRITFSWDIDGGFYSHTYSASADNGYANSSSYPAYRTALYCVGLPEYANQFGNCTLMPGYSLVSMANYLGTGADEDIDERAMKVLFGDQYETIKLGTPVQVTIVDTPSNQMIYDKEIVVT